MLLENISCNDILLFTLSCKSIASDNANVSIYLNILIFFFYLLNLINILLFDYTLYEGKKSVEIEKINETASRDIFSNPFY